MQRTKSWINKTQTLGIILILALSMFATILTLHALTPVTSVTSSNLVVLGSTLKLQSCDGTGITISEISDISFIGLLNNQVLGYNSTTGLWQNMNQTGTGGGSGNSYSYGNLTDADAASFVVLTNGYIPMYNSTTGKWQNTAPFTASWNATVNALIAAASITWAQITGASTQVNSLISAYLIANPIAYSSLTGLPTINYYNYGNLTGTLNLPLANVTNTSPEAFSYLITTSGPGGVVNGSYFCVNGSTMQYVNSWTSTNAQTLCTSLSSILQSGNSVYFQSGTFPLTCWNITTPKIALIGDPSGQTILSANGVSFGIIQYGASGNAVNGLVVKNIAFNMNNSISGVVSGAAITDWGSGATIDSCSFYNPVWDTSTYTPTSTGGGEAIHFACYTGDNRNGETVSNCNFTNIANYGVYPDGGIDKTYVATLSNVNIFGCRFDHIYYNAIALYAVDSGSIYGNTITYSGHTAISLSPARNINVFGNSINNTYPFTGDALTDGIEGGIEAENFEHPNAYNNFSYGDNFFANTIMNSAEGIILRNENAGNPVTGINCEGNNLVNIVGTASMTSTSGYYLENCLKDQIIGGSITNVTKPSASYNVQFIQLYLCTFISIKQVTMTRSDVYGINCGGGDSGTSNNNTIQGNTISDWGIAKAGGAVGIAVYSSSNWIEGNKLSDDQASPTSTYGIYVYPDFSPMENILQNSVFDNITTPVTINGFCTIPDCNIQTVIAGEAISAGDLLFTNSTGKYYEANAVSTTRLGTNGLVVMAIQSAVLNGPCPIITKGVFNDPNWSFTKGVAVYVSNSTNGGWTQTIPITSGNVDDYAGYGCTYSSNAMVFDPNSITILR